MAAKVRGLARPPPHAALKFSAQPQKFKFVIICWRAAQIFALVALAPAHVAPNPRAPRSRAPLVARLFPSPFPLSAAPRAAALPHMRAFTDVANGAPRARPPPARTSPSHLMPPTRSPPLPPNRTRSRPSGFLEELRRAGALREEVRGLLAGASQTACPLTHAQAPSHARNRGLCSRPALHSRLVKPGTLLSFP